MLENNIVFTNFHINEKKLDKNLLKAKRAFNTLLTDLKNFEIPFLESYKEDYSFSFSSPVLLLYVLLLSSYLV